MAQPPVIDAVWREKVCQLTEEAQEAGVARYHRGGRHNGQLSIGGRLVGHVSPDAGRLIEEMFNHRITVLHALYAVPAESAPVAPANDQAEGADQILRAARAS